MKFQSLGDKKNPAIVFFHAMGVTGESSSRVAECLKEKYFCVMPTSTVYCAGQTYVSKQDEIRQVEGYLQEQGVKKIALVVASSIGADLGLTFLTQTKIPVDRVFLMAVSLRGFQNGRESLWCLFCIWQLRVCIGQKGQRWERSCGAVRRA